MKQLLLSTFLFGSIFLISCGGGDAPTANKSSDESAPVTEEKTSSVNEDAAMKEVEKATETMNSAIDKAEKEVDDLLEGL